MMRVAEGNRLFAGDAGLSRPLGSAPRAEQPQQETQNEHRSEDAHFRERVRAAMKDLGHTGRSAICGSCGLRPGVPYSRCLSFACENAETPLLRRMLGF